MSTYIDSGNKIHASYDDWPPLLQKYIIYERVINKSEKTINGYYVDIRSFLRFLKIKNGLSNGQEKFEDILIGDIPEELITGVTSEDIVEFQYFLRQERNNSPRTSVRKLSALQSFYKYLVTKLRVMEINPVQDVDRPDIKEYEKKLPVYLSIEQAQTLLKSINTEFTERDYCIVTLFLNCGMRLTELVSINLSDIHADENYIIINGKGRKQRSAYLNDACNAALERYISARTLITNIEDEDALFVSKRTRKRLTSRGVEKAVEKMLLAAGLSTSEFSPHKFRHTAATLMYQSGDADLLTIQNILGHESSKATEIYTHISNDACRKAIENGPLAQFDVTKPKQANEK